MFAESQRELLDVGQQALQLGQRPRRHQHLLALAQHRGAREIAHRQPVRVGGHQPQAGLLGRHQHAGEDGSGVVATGTPNDLAQRFGQVGRRQADLVASDGRRQPRELVGGQHAHGELRAARHDARLVVVGLDGDGAGLEGAHDVGSQAGGHDTDTVVALGDLRIDLDGEIEIAASQEQAIALHLESHA